MLILLAVLFLCSLPIISYLLSPVSPQKPLIFLLTILLLGAFSLNHSSSKPLFGQWANAHQSDQIYKMLQDDLEVSGKAFNEFIFAKDSMTDSFLFGAEIFYKSLEMNSFNSSESILNILNTSFQDEKFKVSMFNLIADLRDAKHPMAADVKLLLVVTEPANCNIETLTAIVNIPNGPDVNIAVKNFLSPDLSLPLLLDKSDALVRGFDLPSAFLNQAIVKLEVNIFCSKNTFQIFKMLDLKYSENNEEQVFIYANEWLKKEQ
ncbi:hypothetical protein N9753_02875 [Gammaproteobacteria bacterium]|nr:hypothetical protein [Gammaproteobacteria bacterium]MDB4183894.1 hypothetical protein [Gammaproteobacteria bacterium]